MPETLVKEFSPIQAREDVQAIINKAGLQKHFLTAGFYTTYLTIGVLVYTGDMVIYESAAREYAVLERLYRSLNNAFPNYVEMVVYSPSWELRPPEDEKPPQRWAIHVEFERPQAYVVPKFPFKARPA